MDLALAIRRAGLADGHLFRPPAFAPSAGPVRAIGPLEPDYPLGLLSLVDPPRALFVRGSTDPVPGPSRCLAIIGARRCTAEGRRVARDLAACAARAGLVVVSGLALGVDAAAHEGALDAGGQTLAVLASPVDQPTPLANAGLAREIVETGGWLASERPPGASVRARDFPWRNRLVAAIAGAVVVVEAGLRSGTVGTVEWALSLGRLVGAVPGSVLSPASAGANRLLRDGAAPITCGEDAVGLLSLVVDRRRIRSDAEDAVWRAVPGADAPIEAWLRGSGLERDAARAALLTMVARGELVRRGGRVSRCGW